MIGGDDLDIAPGERLPEPIDLAARPQGRSALGNRAEPFHVLLIEHKIVRAGLSRHIEPTGASRGDLGDAATGADVDDMQGTPGLLGEEDGARDRLDLGDCRSRGEVVTGTDAPRRDGPGGQVPS